VLLRVLQNRALLRALLRGLLRLLRRQLLGGTFLRLAFAKSRRLHLVSMGLYHFLEAAFQKMIQSHADKIRTPKGLPHLLRLFVTITIVRYYIRFVTVTVYYGN
jgi:hypothetical protein